MGIFVIVKDAIVDIKKMLKQQLLESRNQK